MIVWPIEEKGHIHDVYWTDVYDLFTNISPVEEKIQINKFWESKKYLVGLHTNHVTDVALPETLVK